MVKARDWLSGLLGSIPGNGRECGLLVRTGGTVSQDSWALVLVLSTNSYVTWVKSL